MRTARSVKAWAIACVLFAAPAVTNVETGSKALDEQDSAHPQRAAELYRAGLDKAPEFGPARQNLARVQKSGD